MKRPPMRLLALLLLGAVAIGLIRGGTANQAPALARNCAVPALALSTYRVAANAPVEWSAVGPEGPRYLLVIDAVAAKITATGQVTLTPAPGIPLAKVELASAPLFLAGCKATGRFGALVPVGQHTVRLLELGPGGVAVVASKPLTVTGP
ncbi:MAG: hypothetical protein ACYDB7_00810 [Mycobacteriales bacterium]